MGILFISDGIYPFVLGGIQKHSRNFLRALLQMGQKVHLVHCVPFGESPIDHAALCHQLGVPDTNCFSSDCVVLPKPGKLPGHYIKTEWQYAQKIWSLVSDKIDHFDVVYAKGLTSRYILKMKKRHRFSTPIMVMLHGYEMFQKPPNLKSKLQQILLLRGPVREIHKSADLVHSYGGKISDLIKNKLGVDSKKIIELPSGIEASWLSSGFSKQMDEPLKIAFLGRWERRKGIVELLEVLQKEKALNTLEFHMIGPIPLANRINKDHVLFYGEIRDEEKIKSILDECHVLICPSHSEGMPNVILEGMARGMAIIATDVGASAMLVDSKNGLLLSRCSKAIIKEALLTIQARPMADIQQMGKISLERVKEQFTWDKLAKVFIDSLEAHI